MDGAQFLDLLEQRQWLSPKLLESLRQQVAAAQSDITAEAIARQLVAKNRLLPEQAEDLLRSGDSPNIAEELSLAPDEALGERDHPSGRAEGSASAASSASADAGNASLLEEELGGPAGDPLDQLLDDPLLANGALGDPLAAGGATLGTGAKRKKRPARDRSKSQWDSPLMLVGGGGLLFLLLVGGVALWFINRGGGDEQLKVAQEFYRQGSYTQAIANYDAFLEDYASHPEASRARVQRGLARIRQATDGTSRFSAALETAKTVLREVEDEPAFPQSRDDLRALLPAIAEGLAAKAGAAEDPAEVQGLVDQTREALVLLANTKYVPKSVRPEQRIEQIEGALNVVTRDLERDSQLQQTLLQIETLVQQQKTNAAFAARRALLKTYPDLRDDERIASAARSIAEAEAGNVRVVEDGRPALTEERSSPLVAELALAHRRAATEPSAAASQPVVVRVQGALYGLDRATGRLLWRRWTGADAAIEPVALGDAAGAVLAVDAQHDQLLRIDTGSGELRWRLPIEDRASQPVVVRERAFVATRSGKVMALDVEQGTLLRHALVPQPLAVSPAVDFDGRHLYQVGSHSNVYVLSADNLQCQEVFYLGHEPGTVAVPAVVAGRALLVAENWGLEDATLHVIALDEQGRSLRAAQQIRLKGHVLTPPRVAGRQVAVATDRGEIHVFEVSTASQGQPLIELVHRDPEPGAPLVRHLMLDESRLWVADRQLGRYTVHASSQRLVPQPIDEPDDGDVFVAPLKSAGELVISQRRRKAAAGVTVSAVDAQSGRRRWQTNLAVPPAGAPVVNLSPPEIGLVSVAGDVFKLDAAAIQARVHDQPLKTARPESAEMLTERVQLGGHTYVFAPGPGGRACLTYTLAAKNPARWFELPRSLVCSPAALAGALVTPVEGGQVLLLDPATGTPRVAPFQPRLEPGVSVDWLTPSAVSDASEVVVADALTRLYRLGIEEQPAPHLAAQAQSSKVAQPLVSPVACLGKLAVAVDATDRLQKFSLPDLQPAGELAVGGEVIWGPRRVGPLILLVNDLHEMIAVEESGEIRWRRPLEHGPLAGQPLLDGATYVCAAPSGFLFRIDARTGKTLAQIDLGQPLATGAVTFGTNLIVAGQDGTLLVARLPAEEK